MGRTKHSEKFNPFSSVLRVTLSFVLMLAALATTPKGKCDGHFKYRDGHRVGDRQC